MEYIKSLGYKISRLILGTAQLGSNYGIANKFGRLSKAQIKRIIFFAFDNGINFLDTAYAYGKSEEILGGVLSEYPKRNRINIITKLNPFKISSEVDKSFVIKQVKKSLITSLDRLNLNYIPIYMLHRTSHLKFSKGLIINSLIKLKEKGLIEHIGVSVYTPDEANCALLTEGIEVVEIPFSIFDQRLKRGGFFELAKKRGVTVFARSVFLQGLVLMDVEDVPIYLREIIPFKKRLEQICNDAGKTIKEVALRFILAQEGINSVIVGVDNLTQLKENISIFNDPPLKIEVVKKIQASFNRIPEHLINPTYWKK